MVTTPSSDDRALLPHVASRPRDVGALLRRALFGIAPEETSFARRGFRMGAGAGAAEVRERLEEVGRCFVRGYHAAL
jgi:hypothetical protein